MAHALTTRHLANGKSSPDKPNFYRALPTFAVTQSRYRMMNRNTRLTLLLFLAGAVAPARAIDMDVAFTVSGTHYLCNGASQVSVLPGNHPRWRWFCGGQVQNCSEDSLTAVVAPSGLGGVAPAVVLTCSETAVNLPDLLFRDGEE